MSNKVDENRFLVYIIIIIKIKISYSKLSLGRWPTRRASRVAALRDTIKNYPDMKRQ